VKITVTSGAFSTTGDLLLRISDKKELKTAYKREPALSNFSSVDKANAEDFLKWESLSFSDLNVGYNPLLINIKGISLTKFYSIKSSRQPHTVRFSSHSLHALRINMRLISRKSPSVICREKCPRRMFAFLRRKDFAVLDSNVKMLKILNIHSMELKILGL
jgi:hypothetical protein